MKGEYLGMSVIISVGNQVFTGPQKQGALLVNYDESNDTYTGVIFPKNDKFTQFFENLGKGEFAAGTPINVGVVLRIPGLRRYPYVERPNYPFQFVLAGEDHSVLTNIAAANYAEHQATHISIPEEHIEEEEIVDVPVNTESEDIPLWKKLGYSTKQLWIEAGRPGK